MANRTRNLSERLDEAVEVMMQDPNAPRPPLDAKLARLLRIATDLRDLPSQDFKMRLKADLSRAARPIRTRHVPTGQAIIPFLHVRGAAQLIAFLRQAFDGREIRRETLADGRISHAEVQIGDAQVSMSEASAEFPPTQTALHLYVADADRAYAQALDAGATPMQEPTDQPYGDREAGVKDPFGNNWYIATHKGSGPRTHVPDGLRSVTPYLHPHGANELIAFLQAAFDAQEAFAHRSPTGQVEHAKIRIGNAMLEMGEAHGPYQPASTALHVYVDDTDRAYQRALEAGATALFAPVDREYGERLAAVKDRFGTTWYIATRTKG